MDSFIVEVCNQIPNNVPLRRSDKVRSLPNAQFRLGSNCIDLSIGTWSGLNDVFEFAGRDAFFQCCPYLSGWGDVLPGVLDALRFEYDCEL